VVVGEFFADLVVEDSVIVEVKAAKAIDEKHEAQLLNYLRATGFRLGLILNFGTPKIGIDRRIL
jgi:GxxExxY protein